MPVINWEKCLTATQNVRQSAEGLPDILSGTSEIIFPIPEWIVEDVAINYPLINGPLINGHLLRMINGGTTLICT